MRFRPGPAFLLYIIIIINIVLTYANEFTQYNISTVCDVSTTEIRRVASRATFCPQNWLVTPSAKFRVLGYVILCHATMPDPTGKNKLLNSVWFQWF